VTPPSQMSRQLQEIFQSEFRVFRESLIAEHKSVMNTCKEAWEEQLAAQDAQRQDLARQIDYLETRIRRKETEMSIMSQQLDNYEELLQVLHHSLKNKLSLAAEASSAFTQPKLQERFCI